MTPEQLKTIIQRIIQKDRRYHENAYIFANEAVLFSTEYFHKPDFGSERHLSPVELLDGIREFAVSEFGPMTKTVMFNWGISNTLDFGNIIFNLIDARVLTASENDRLGDFDEVYDFDDVFVKIFDAENSQIDELKKIDYI
jgi:uncharacterized repeat protein (TIGR04138 family)